MRVLTFLLSILFSSCLLAQFHQELPPMLKEKGFENNKLQRAKQLKDMLNMEDRMQFKEKETIPLRYDFKANTQASNIKKNTTIDMNKVRNYYVGPSNVYIDSRYPHANDYKFRGINSLGNNLYISSISVRQTVPTIGASSTIGAQLHFKASDRFSISGGPSIIKYNTYGNHYNDIGVSGAMDFKVNDIINLKAFGSTWKQGSGGMGSPAFNYGNSKSYGGAMEMKISDKFGVGMGMERELNPFTGKWINKPLIYPIFY